MKYLGGILEDAVRYSNDRKPGRRKDLNNDKPGINRELNYYVIGGGNQKHQRPFR